MLPAISLSGAELAPGPSQLMRSRYSAFVMKDADYLIKTLAPVLSGAVISRRAGERVFPDRMAGLNPVRQ